MSFNGPPTYDDRTIGQLKQVSTRSDRSIPKVRAPVHCLAIGTVSSNYGSDHMIIALREVINKFRRDNTPRYQVMFDAPLFTHHHCGVLVFEP